MTDSHTVTITLTSRGDDESVDLSVKWDPVMGSADIERLGYLPAAFGFVQTYILPALELAMEENLDAPTQTKH